MIQQGAQQPILGQAGQAQPFQYNGPTYPSLAASLAAAGANPNAFAAGQLQQPQLGGFGQQLPAGTNVGFGTQFGGQQFGATPLLGQQQQFPLQQQPILGQYNPYQAPTFNPYGQAGLGAAALPVAGLGGFNPYANVVAQALQGAAGAALGYQPYGQQMGGPMMGMGMGQPIQFGGQQLGGFQQPMAQRAGPMGPMGGIAGAGPMGPGGPQIGGAGPAGPMGPGGPGGL
jgi:hypothetical protein